MNSTNMSAREYQHKRFRSRGGDTSGKGGHGPTLPQSPMTGGDPTENGTAPRVVTPSLSSPSSKSTGSGGVLTNGTNKATHSLRFDQDVVATESPRKVNMDNPSVQLPQEQMAPNSNTVLSVGSDEYSESGSGSGSNTISKGMKQMIQAYTEQPVRTPVTPERMVHHQTSSGKSLDKTPLGKPLEPIRYSLSTGSNGMSEAMRKASDTASLEGKKSSKERRHSLNRKKDVGPNAHKIFVLLLQPKSKIFELIQLIYSPYDTTVGKILEMIPENATETSLGAQVYDGLCRPKGDEFLTDKDLMATPTRPGMESAKISLGEILVAIPEGFTGEEVAALSKQILGNPKIAKLLKRSDPLAPKSKKRSSRRHHHRHRRSSSRKAVQILDKHDELDEIQEEKLEKLMKQAMEHAQAEAAAANAAIPGGIKRCMSDDKSFSEVSSSQASLDESYSSWSKSFENSFSAQSSICSGASRRAVRRRERQARRMVILKRTAGVAFLLMVVMYFTDPEGYASRNTNIYKNHDVTDAPMGLLGIFQCLFLLLTLYKMERFVRTEPNRGDDPTRRRCPFLRASATALEGLRSRYATKLARKISRTRSESPDSLSHRLRAFSLKAAQHNDADTGSL